MQKYETQKKSIKSWKSGLHAMRHVTNFSHLHFLPNTIFGKFPCFLTSQEEKNFL